MATYTVAELNNFVGTELGCSRWFDIDQKRINDFADCTEDHQWIHVDEERASNESPFGGTIAHGFLGLSLIAPAQIEIGVYPTDNKQIVNYGLDKVRFMAPVPAGSKVRVRVSLEAAEQKAPERYVLRILNALEIEGKEEPVMIAESLAMVMV